MNWIKVAGTLGFTGVALGAFGAHALKAKLPPDMLTVYHTAVLYHLIHALALLALAFYGRSANVNIQFGAIGFLGGIILFSGSLYALALTGFKPLGAITPLGGLCFLISWAWIVLRLKT